jgi:DNA-binding GntR family transcriptional regulator
MSATPIREALRLLQADGLVDYRPHYGIIVAESNSPESIVEIHRIRVLLEPLATELAVSAMTDETLDELERLHRELGEACSSGDGRAFSEINASWHATLYGAGNTTYLRDFISRLWQGFPWLTIWVLPGRPAMTLREHGEIMEAIRRRDGAAAAALMREHIESGQDTVDQHDGNPL